MDVSDGVSVIDCAELYEPATGDADTVGGVVSIVYNDVEIMPELLRESTAKYFSVVVELIEIGVEYTGLDVVGSLPSVV